MKNKIPPPIVTLIFGLAIYFSKNLFPNFDIGYLFYSGFVLEIVGIGIIISSALSFRKNKTTVNPLKPNTASSLVVEGTFVFSRNPMYLGLLFILIGLALQTNIIGGIIIIPLFIFCMNVLQIIPEEEAMLLLFEEEFKEYKSKVRRWL